MSENKRFRYVEATAGVDEHIIDYSTEPHFEYYTLKGATDKLNELTCKLKRTERGRTELAEFNVQLMEENKELKAKVDDKEVAVEVECEKLMQKVLDLIDEKIKLYSHKPVSAPISQPMSVNFDEDVDRLARLSELEALKEELIR